MYVIDVRMFSSKTPSGNQLCLLKNQIIEICVHFHAFYRVRLKNIPFVKQLKYRK